MQEIDTNTERKRARILFVEGNQDGTVGGSYFSLLYLASGLDRRQFEPIVAFHRDNPLVPRFNAAGVETRIVSPGRPVTFSTPLGRIAAKAANFIKGFVLDPLRLARMLRREQFALLHLNNSITSNHAWMLAASYAGIPCVTHERGINSTYSARSQWLARRLDAVICISKAVEDNFRQRGLHDLPLVTIPNGLDPDQMRPGRSPEEVRSELRIPPNRRLIGIVGNVKPWKGQDLVIRALARLLRSGHDVTCLIIGDNADANRVYGQSVQTLASELDVTDRVVITGYKQNVADYVNALDVLVHASKLPEPFGRVLLEGMALSKPIVASRGGGVPEIVVHGDTGLLFEPGSELDLSSSIARLLNDGALATQLGTRGRGRLSERFGIDRNIHATAELYELILQSNRHSLRHLRRTELLRHAGKSCGSDS